MRRGSAHCASKVVWFLGETLRRVPLGCRKKRRAHSGFYDKAVVACCEANAICEADAICEANAITFAISADQSAPLLGCIEALAESAWCDLEK